MNTITLPKIEYQKILQNQSNFTKELHQLKSVVKIALADEVNDRVKAKLEKQSKIMDRGQNRVFKSIKEFDKYLESL